MAQRSVPLYLGLDSSTQSVTAVVIAIDVASVGALQAQEGRKKFLKKPLVIEDQGSLNGTFLNRRRIESGLLEDDDELQIGKYKLTFLS